MWLVAPTLKGVHGMGLRSAELTHWATPSRAVGRKRVIRDCDPPQRWSDGDGSDEGQNYHRRKPSGHPLRHYGEFTYSAVTGRVGLALDLRAQRLASIRLD
jgi:hypothetical protein